MSAVEEKPPSKPRRKRMIARGPAPIKPYRNIVIQLGIIAAEVSVFAGTESPKSGRSSFVRVGDSYHPVGMAPYDKTTGHMVDESEVVKGVLVGQDQVIEISDGEMQELGFKRTVVPILGTLDLSTENLNWLIANGTHYQLYPTTIKAKNEVRLNEAWEQNFAAIIGGLRATNTCALVELIFQEDGAKKWGYITPNPYSEGGARLTLVYTSDELRPWRDHVLAEVDEGSQRLMKQIINRMRLPFVPEMADERSRALRELIDAKRAGDLSRLARPIERGGPPIMSLEDALEAQLAQLEQGGEGETESE